MTKANKSPNLEWLYEQCADGTPHIGTDLSLPDGVPHIKGTTISVSTILERLYVHDSVQKVVKYYDDVTEEQIKEALAYAARFMELACRPPRSAAVDQSSD